MNILFKIFGGNYDSLWQALIRPNKDEYTLQDLGPIKFEIEDKCYKRTDIEIINKRSQKLMCSYWEPFDEERDSQLMPCVIYLHGNSSSRCEAYQEVAYLLEKNITVFSFDFCGCGKSEGDYISLGYYEKFDVHCVVEYLIKSKKVNKIGLWGRSMGAVTAIMYANEHPSLIDAMILDSGFYSLKMLINELIESKIKLPNFIYEKILNMVKETVQEKAKFNLDIIEPYIYAKNCLVPAFFCHGLDDDFVLPHHSQDLFNEYKGIEKYIEIVEGGHNSIRPRKLINKICNFFLKHLRNDNDNNINDYEKIIDNSDEYDDDDEYKDDKKNLKKEKSEENVSSSLSIKNENNVKIYKKKLIKKEPLNIMKTKSKMMSKYFDNNNNTNNISKINLKKSSILKTPNYNNFKNGRSKLKNSFMKSIIINTPYIKKNNRINFYKDNTYSNNFYIKNIIGTNFIQNNFYMTNNSFFKGFKHIYETKYKNNNSNNHNNKTYFSTNKSFDINKTIKEKEKIIYKKKLKKRLLFNNINSSQKKE